MNIVIIDNDLSLLRSLQLLLARDGHHITLFTDPRHALFYFVRKHLVDVLLIDYSMPEMNGDELIEMLKPELSDHCRIIMMSAHSDLALRVDAKTLGIETLLCKPLDFNQLKQTLIEPTPKQGAIS